MDRRRLREIGRWLEGSRPDAPSEAELRAYEEWIGGEIEDRLARRQGVSELLVLLNAAREALREG